MTSFSSPTLPDPPLEAKPVTRWRWWFHLILIGGYVLPRIAFASQFPRHQPALSHSVGGLLAVSAIELALFALIFALACRVSRPSKEQLLLSWRPGWWVFPLGLGYSIVIRIAAGMALFFVILVLLGTHVLSADSAEHFIVARRPDIAKLVDVAALRADSAYFWLTLTLVSFVVAGVREEMWRAGTLAGLRALWPRFFGSLGGQIGAVALIAIIFGAGHLQLGLIGAIMAGLLGLFLGVIMVLHRSIWPAVIAHGFIDATTFALVPFALQKLGV